MERGQEIFVCIKDTCIPSAKRAQALSPLCGDIPVRVAGCAWLPSIQGREGVGWALASGCALTPPPSRAGRAYRPHLSVSSHCGQGLPLGEGKAGGGSLACSVCPAGFPPTTSLHSSSCRFQEQLDLFPDTFLPARTASSHLSEIVAPAGRGAPPTPQMWLPVWRALVWDLEFRQLSTRALSLGSGSQLSRGFSRLMNGSLGPAPALLLVQICDHRPQPIFRVWITAPPPLLLPSVTLPGPQTTSSLPSSLPIPVQPVSCTKYSQIKPNQNNPNCSAFCLPTLILCDKISSLLIWKHNRKRDPWTQTYQDYTKFSFSLKGIISFVVVFPSHLFRNKTGSCDMPYSLDNYVNNNYKDQQADFS